MRKDHITYEYISKNVKSDLEHIYIDCYKNFGWIHIKNNVKTDYYINNNVYQDIVNIKFKRNRNIENKEELKKLQEKCEKSILTVYKLENKPHSLATMYALITAFVGMIFMTMSAFVITTNSVMWFIGILCGIIGIIGLSIPYFVYKNVKNKKELECRVKIEKEQDIIHDIYIKARDILLE